MIETGGVISVSNYEELKMHLLELVHNDELREDLGHLNRKFIENNKGAVIQIMDFIRR